MYIHIDTHTHINNKINNKHKNKINALKIILN